MKLNDLPFIGTLFPAGERDPVFDALMVLGPAVILLVVLLGRSPITVALAAAYVLAIPAYVLYRAVRR